MQPLIAEDADINFASGDVLLSNSMRLCLAMDELDALGELLVVVTIDARAIPTDPSSLIDFTSSGNFSRFDRFTTRFM